MNGSSAEAARQICQLSPESYRVLTEVVNPRSVTGLVALNSDPRGGAYHYKRTSQSIVEATEIARAAESTSAIQGVNVVRLIGLDPDGDLFISENVAKHETLANYAWNRSRAFDVRGLSSRRAEFLGERLGKWLRAYHRSSLSSREHWEEGLDYIVQTALRKLEKLRGEASFWLPDKALDAIREYLLHAPRGISNFECAKVHGDFVPANILVVENGELVVMDFADSREGLALEDLVRLWHGLWTISRVSRRRRRLLTPFMQSLLVAYDVNIGEGDSPLFRLLRCWNAICQLRTTITMEPRLGFIDKAMTRRLTRINARWLRDTFLERN